MSSRRAPRAPWIAIAATVVLLGGLAWLWAASLVPGTLSVMAMGYPDLGGGPAVMHEHGMTPGTGPGEPTSNIEVTELTGQDDKPADVSVDLVARSGRFALASGREVEGFTVNGSSPGPPIEATQGQLVQVRLVNESVPDGITLHWHGVNVPNAEDGVAGVTQDAVAEGQEHTYRFVAEDVGTYWYHSHQVSHEQVQRGLLGALIVHPKDAGTAAPPADLTALVHIYEGVRTVNGQEGASRLPLSPGTTARVRVINTDSGPMSVWVTGAPLRVLAIDGTDVHSPTPITDAAVLLTAGARADLEVVAPQDGTAVRVELGGSAALVLGPAKAPEPLTTSRPDQTVDFLTYGSPAPAGPAAGPPDRTFEYSIGRRPGLIDGRPGLWWTINGHLYPDVPMYVVREGDIVRMRISNSSGDVHPMHLHGHHAVVLSRNGVPASGSPWWVDSLNVAEGETYEIGFVADNPGIWMDHCHNLVHAADGMVAHLAYEGVTTPFVLGGPAQNAPE